MADAARESGDRSIITRKVLLAVCLALAAVIYYPVIVPLVRQWVDDPNYTHGLLIPPVSALLLWRRREELSACESGGGRAAGLILVLTSFILLIAGTAASELFTARISLPLMIFGSVLYLRGRQFAGKAAFAILLLMMMVPLPYIIYYKMTFPMQIMSAKMSSAVLRAIGVSVIRRGNILMLPGYTLEVVAACSGLRSLMTMVTLSMVMAAFSSMGRIRDSVLIACSVPVAVAANTVRLVVTAVGAYTVGAQFADGPLHEISGLIVFLAGLLLLILCRGLLRWTR
ncbi:MAG TPA: exosortase/archaeosortase family protein [Candidatus Krumholzibacterium sp.]|nr:exosortase/archaeosortase family protein [Candidatus Krumholzibacterium sp.]